MRGLTLVAFAVALTLQACGGSSDPQKARQTLASWEATTRLARAQYRAGNISERYLRQLLDRAREARQEQRRR